MLEVNKVYNMDCLEGLKQLDDECIDLVITSPPYFGLRDYGSDIEIGKEANYKKYLDNLMLIFNEIHRVLKSSGSLWINIGDVYSSGNDIQKQSLMCIPDRLKIMMVDSGWICRNEIIWHKPNAMPSSAKTRFNTDFEKFYFFTKTNDYYFKTQYEPMKSNNTHAHGKMLIKGSKYESIEQESSVRAGMNKSRGEKVVALRKNLPEQFTFVSFIREHTTVDELADKTNIKRTTIEHWFRKDSSGFSFPSAEDWNSIKEYVDDGSDTFKQLDKQLTDITYETDSIMKNVTDSRVKRAVWSINTKAFKGYHYAPYPEELIEIPIDACCPEGGIVLDPFMGSGTTGLVARLAGNDYIGFEINEEYCNIARQRLMVVKPIRLF